MIYFKSEGQFHIGVHRRVEEKNSRVGTIFHGTDKLWYFDATSGRDVAIEIEEMRQILMMMNTLARVGAYGSPVSPDG